MLGLHPLLFFGKKNSGAIINFYYHTTYMFLAYNMKKKVSLEVDSK